MNLRRRILPASIGGALVAAPLIFAAAVYQGELEREIDRVSRGSELADTRCGPIEYASLGEGPAVLLVHGAGGGFDQGLDALGIDRAAVVGISAGAPSSMQFALRHRQRATHLALLVPLAYAPREHHAPSRTAQFMLERAIRSDLLYWATLKAAPALIVETVLATPPALLEAASPGEQARAREVVQHLLPLSRRAHRRADARDQRQGRPLRHLRERALHRGVHSQCALRGLRDRRSRVARTPRRRHRRAAGVPWKADAAGAAVNWCPGRFIACAKVACA